MRVEEALCWYGGRKNITIMSAEDERDIQDLICLTLLVHGYDVVRVRNGREALDVLDSMEDRILLVLMDVRMPIMTGYEACEIIKQEHPSVPVVFLSAKGQESEIKRGIDLGGEEYLLKPFAPDELIDRVNSIVERLCI